MSIFSLTRKLASVRRFSRDFSINEESVLEHIGFCALYSLHVASRLTRDKGVYVDRSILLQKAILHDVEEAETGDINRKAKYYSKQTREALAEFESDAAMKICSELFDHFSLNLWRNAKDGLEGKIVKLSDYAAVAFHIANEMYGLGNWSFNRVKTEACEFIDEALATEEDELFIDELKYIRRVLTGDMPV
jgi:5'-deoxynucleotidase YfbR-like HD superfamily hydrolase